MCSLFTSPLLVRRRCFNNSIVRHDVDLSSRAFIVQLVLCCCGLLTTVVPKTPKVVFPASQRLMYSIEATTVDALTQLMRLTMNKAGASFIFYVHD